MTTGVKILMIVILIIEYPSEISNASIVIMTLYNLEVLMIFVRASVAVSDRTLEQTGITPFDALRAIFPLSLSPGFDVDSGSVDPLLNGTFRSRQTSA